jgi:hypothetical protein
MAYDQYLPASPDAPECQSTLIDEVDGQVTSDALDPFTILTPTSAKQLAAKIISPTSVTPYSLGKTFTHKVAGFSNIHELSEVLRELAIDKQSFVIAGNVKEGVGAITNRLLRNKPAEGRMANIQEVPVRWANLDVDELPLPFDIRENPEAAAKYVLAEIARVWPGVDRVSVVVQFSNSAGQPGKEKLAKMHVWVILTKAHLPSDMRRVIDQLNINYRELTGIKDKKFKLIDPAVFNAVQPHYTASPIFRDGATDPMPTRLLVLPGEQDFLELPPLSESLLTKAPKVRGPGNERPAGDHRSVKHPEDITSNRSRNAYFVKKVSQEFANFGPYADRERLESELREAVSASQAEPGDKARWVQASYLQREIDDAIRYLRENEYEGPFGLFVGNHEQKLIRERWLPPIERRKGVDLIKSPMGSGKTRQLGELAKHCDSILVVTHRVSLAGELARRLNLDSYLDEETNLKETARVAVCVNSLHQLGNQTFDTVVLEESEQLLRHLAHLKQKDKVSINHGKLEWLLKQADQVVALDAQMSQLTVKALEQVRPEEKFRILDSIFENPKIIRLLTKKQEAISAFSSALRRRGGGEPRAAFVSNSRKACRRVFLQCRREFPALRGALITSDTVGNPDIQQLLADFDGVGTGYDYVVCSPAVSTGISIEKLDFEIYGLFEARINAHTDIAQAISRFRRADTVTLWIARGSRHDGIGAEQIAEAKRAAMLEYDIFVPEFADNSTLGSGTPWRGGLWSAVYDFEQRAKGLLRQNLLCLAHGSGWTVEFAEFDRSRVDHGKALDKAGRALEEVDYVEMVLNAPDITPTERAELETKHRTTSTEKAAVDKSKLAEFYGQTVNEDLVKRDGRGKRRQGIRNLELVGEPDPVRIMSEDFEEAHRKTTQPETFLARMERRRLLTLFLRAVGLPERVDQLTMDENGKLCISTTMPEGVDPEEPWRWIYREELTPLRGWTTETVDRGALTEIGRRRVEIKAHLGRSTPHDFAENPLGFINQVLKEVLALPVVCGGRRRKSVNRERWYTLDIEALRALRWDLTSRRIQRANGQLPDWSQAAQNLGLEQWEAVVEAMAGRTNE